MPHRKATILVVDDIADDRVMTRMILEKHGFSIEEAGSAEELMDELKLGKLDLVVLDVQMPGLDCLNILEKIRQYNLESRYPCGKSDVGVILYTSLSVGTAARNTYQSKGAASIVMKEQHPDVLVEEVEAFLGRHKHMHRAV